MAAGSSVTCTHCSVRYEVTWGKKVHVRATYSHLRGHRHVHADATMRTHGHRPVRADEVISLPSPSLCSLALHRRVVASARTREKKLNVNFFFGCWLLEKRKRNVRFSVFNPQDPQDP
jgi:hypothetical protein